MGLIGRICLMCPIGPTRISGSRIELRWAALARQRVEDEDDDENEDDSHRLRMTCFAYMIPRLQTFPYVQIGLHPPSTARSFTDLLR